MIYSRAQVLDQESRLCGLDLLLGVRGDKTKGLAASSVTAPDACRRILDNEAVGRVDAAELCAKKIRIRSEVNELQPWEIATNLCRNVRGLPVLHVLSCHKHLWGRDAGGSKSLLCIAAGRRGAQCPYGVGMPGPGCKLEGALVMRCSGRKGRDAHILHDLQRTRECDDAAYSLLISGSDDRCFETHGFFL